MATKARRQHAQVGLPNPAVERRLAAFTEIAQTMVSGLDYERILAAVIEKVARLLDAASGGFMLYDSSAQELRLQKPAFGLQNDDLIAMYRVPLAGGGNAASVFVTGQPYVSNDAKNDPKLLKPFPELYDANRVLTVPLKIEGRTIGVFHAINKRSGDFSVEDVDLLSLLAPQLAIVIQAAEMLRGLKAHEEQTDRVISHHNALIAMVLTRGSLDELAIRLSELLNLPVLAAEWGGAMYTGSVMEPEQRSAAMSELDSVLGIMNAQPRVGLEPLTVPLQDSELVSVPIAAGPELLGAVGAVISVGSIDDLLVRTLQQASLVFALAIMKEREVREVERRFQTTIVERLLLAENLEDSKHLLQRLGIPSDGMLRVARFIVTPEKAAARSANPAPNYPFSYRALSAALTNHWRGAVAVERDGGMHMILPSRLGTPLEAELGKLRAVADEIARRKANPGGFSMLIAVGGTVAEPTQLRRSDVQAQVTGLIGRTLEPWPSVLFYEQLGVYRLLAQPVDAADVDEFVQRVLGPLADHDARRNSDWMTFLEVLADCNFSAKNAARRLNIHHNTAKYRAARITELIGQSLDSPHTRMEIQLALAVLRTRQTLSPETSSPASAGSSISSQVTVRPSAQKAAKHAAR